MFFASENKGPLALVTVPDLQVKVPQLPVPRPGGNPGAN